MNAEKTSAATEEVSFIPAARLANLAYSFFLDQGSRRET